MHFLIESSIHISYVLGLVNSKLISFYHLNTSANAFKESFPKLLLKDIEGFPLPKLDLLKTGDKKIQDDLGMLVDKMLDLHKQLAKTNFDSEREPIERQIKATDKNIDQLVYQLYGLTEEEIKVVEGE